MKKLVSLILAMLMLVAFSVPVFAATDAAEVKAAIDAYATKAGVTAAQAAEAKAMVDKMNADTITKLDIKAVAAVAKSNEAAIKAGTLNIETFEKDINAVLPNGVALDLSDAAVSGSKLTLNVSVKIPAAASSTGAEVTSKVAVSNNGTPAETTTNNPVKATGADVNTTSLAVLGMAIVACLGVAVVFTRKLGATE